MAKKQPPKKPHTQRPKGPGAKQRPAKRPKSAPAESSAVESAPAPRQFPHRERKPAPLPTDLVAPAAAPRCGRDDCAVCGSKRSEDRAEPCPNVEEPLRKYARDPRNNDPKSKWFRAPREVFALANDPSTASESQRQAISALRAQLESRGDDLTRWPSLLREVVVVDRAYSVDEIISDLDNRIVLEFLIRERYYVNGGKPSEEEVDAMGELEVFGSKRIQGYKAPWKHSTPEDSTAVLAEHCSNLSRSEEAWKFFESYVYKGTKWTKQEGKSWGVFWKGCDDLLSKDETSIRRKSSTLGRFYGQLWMIKKRPDQTNWAWDHIDWFQARKCRYQCCPTTHSSWRPMTHLSTQVLKDGCRGASRPRTRSSAGRAATSLTAASGGACWRQRACSSTATWT